MDKKQILKIKSVAIIVLVSVAIATMWWILFLYDGAFGWIGMIASLTVMCTVYWFAIMKLKPQPGELLKSRRFGRVLLSTLIQIVFLFIVEKIYILTHPHFLEPKGHHSPAIMFVIGWYWFAPLLQNVMTAVICGTLHRIRVMYKASSSTSGNAEKSKQQRKAK